MFSLDGYQQRWLVLCGGYLQSVALAVYKNLRLRYAESHRAYHTFEHIRACLYHFDAVSKNLSDPLSVELALWFHDVIYDPKSQTNELDSAVYAALALDTMATPEEVICKVYHLILLTQHPSQPLDYDEKTLIDIDLSILGAEKGVFLVYESQIRSEYRWVEEGEYHREREKVLQHFLAQERLYQTDYFFEKREQQARKNLAYGMR